MSGFSIDWLDLREAADGRARDRDLLQRAGELLRRNRGERPLVVDLGAGTGATLRAFISLESLAPVRWRLVDHDAALLAEARRRHDSAHEMETCQADLADVAALPLGDASLITASALFDLVSATFIESLADSIISSPALYAALNYDGRMEWAPSHPLDAAVRAAFNKDQRRDKGFGPALGPEATACLQHCLTERGYAVHVADSPWLLEAGDSELVHALIEGIAAAVAGYAALDGDALAEWAEYRKSQAAGGRCLVGHMDVLALPAA